MRALPLDRCVSVQKKSKKKIIFFFFFCHREIFFFLLAHSLTHASCTQPSRKSFKTKRLLGAARKSNKPLPPWIRQRTGNTVR
jgi:hypothetical protein